MITWIFVPLDLILPDQPNRIVRTRTLRGVGGALCEGRPYPDSPLIGMPYSIRPIVCRLTIIQPLHASALPHYISN